jgi:starvation-inducible DNA-binding protein
MHPAIPEPRGNPVSKVTTLKRTAPPELDTPSDLPPKAVAEISEALNGILADSFALYLKTKNFHWHVSGPHFRDYHLLFEEQALRSIGHIAKYQSLEDNNAVFVPAGAMVRELMNDNKAVAAAMRKAHGICDKHEDVATASLLEMYIDATEKRTWFLFEAARGADRSGH